MKTVLLPVKDFKDAKRRLSPVFNERQRQGLARAMLADVLRAISNARIPDRIVVFTASADVAAMAKEHHFECADEIFVQGHSAAVNSMVPELSRTASHVLSIAADLPTLQPAEIDTVFDTASTPVSLVPSRDGTGTNAVLFVSPARIRMEYGEDSLRRHLANAAADGLQTRLLHVPGMEFDVDTPADMRFYLDHSRDDSHTTRYLRSL